MGENNFRVCEGVQHNRVFVAEGRRVGKKRKYICPLGAWTHRKAIWSVILMLAFKYYAQYPGAMQGSQEGKSAKLWGPRAHFGANISMKIVGEFSLICCTSMANAGNTKISAKIISTRAPNAATKPTTYIPPNLRSSPYGNSSWRRQCRMIWPNTPHEKTTLQQVQECKEVYLPTDFCRDLELPSCG